MSAEARSRSANDNTLLSCLARPAAQARFDNPQPGAGTLPQRHARLLGSFRSVVTTELGHVVDPIAFCRVCMGFAAGYGVNRKCES